MIIKDSTHFGYESSLNKLATSSKDWCRDHVSWPFTIGIPIYFFYFHGMRSAFIVISVLVTFALLHFVIDKHWDKKCKDEPPYKNKTQKI